MPVVEHDQSVIEELKARFGAESFAVQPTADGIPTAWVSSELAHQALAYLKSDVQRPYQTLFDLTAIDERVRANRHGQPASDVTVVYHLLSYDRNSDVRLKVALAGDAPSVRTVTDIWGGANWYEREAFDMFGVRFEGHPNLRRILMPPWWVGHPLRKDYPARATEMGPFHMTEEQGQVFQEDLTFRPEDWGMTRQSEDEEYLFLNLGPQHPGTHGPFRVALQLAGEEIVDCVPDIGFHHRAAEKMGERQSWHTYIPYTDRVDYLGGILNELAYLVPLEQLAGIEIPERAKVIRIMLSELFRISSHLVWYGTFAQDVGAMSPVFYMFNDRERVLEIIEAVTGFRMHPVWLRIGGTAADLPNGWDRLVREFVNYFGRKLDEYDKLVLENSIFRGRTQGVGQLSAKDAVEWGASGPVLRATGVKWDFRKMRPYAGYDQFDFEVPTGTGGDAYARAVVHVGELRQSLRIVEQCLNNMPAGAYKADHPLTTPPVKKYTMTDIETLINHFLSVSWGPVIPVGESTYVTEGAKGAYAYYLVSDGDTIPYRVRIRSASFANIQLLPRMVRGASVPDLAATLGSIDFVMADVDR